MSDVQAMSDAFVHFDIIVKNMLNSIEENAPNLNVEPPKQPRPKIMPLIPTR